MATAAWRCSPPSTTSAPAARRQCHAHPAGVKVLGVLDLALNLESVDHEVASMKFRVLLVTGVEITLISLFIIFFTRRFLGRPIEKLIEGTKAVSQMELDKPLDIAGSSEELDELARSFDVMRDRLRTALGEINQFTQNLETKVEERTAAAQGGAEEAAAERPPGVAGTALGQRGARDQQSRLRRAQPVHAAAAHAEGRRHSAEPDRRVSQVSVAGDQRDRARGPHRLRPAGIFAPLQAAARAGRPEQDREDDALAGAAQDEAEQRGRWSTNLREDLPRGCLRPLADPAGGAEPAAECRRGHAEQSATAA